MNQMQKVIPVTRREYIIVDRPRLEDVTVDDLTLGKYKHSYGFTQREAEIWWLLRRGKEVDLSLIPSARTHIYSMRKKLKDHQFKIDSCWRGVYRLSIVGD